MAYAVWIVVALLGIWFLLLSRNAVLGVFAALVGHETLTHLHQIRALERFYLIGMGLAWLAMVIAAEVYFQNGVQRGQLFERFARLLGVVVLLIFVADATLLIVQGLGAADWSRWLILGVELALGVFCVRAARASPSIVSDFLIGDQN